MPKPSTQIQLKPSPTRIPTTPKSEADRTKNTATAEIGSKMTSPTLVEFQNRNAELPDWRLHLKNAVQKRMSQTEEPCDSASGADSIREMPAPSYQVSGSAALKAEVTAETRPGSVDNEQLAKALRRIESSRQKYYVTEPVEANEQEEPARPAKEYPFKIAARNDNPVPAPEVEQKSSVNFPPKPQLVPTQPGETKRSRDLYDTSELDPQFVPARISSSFETRPATAPKARRETPVAETGTEIPPVPEKTVAVTEKTASDTVPAATETAAEEPLAAAETDDLASFALRFNSGVFDLIIGSFASLVLLSPFMLLGGNWFSVSGLIAFAATCAIVMFIYLTTTLGLFGKSFGMHLFALELIDFESDEYPSFHQAAVSSSLYLVSLSFGGLGFITALFDEDRRAVHDLVSGTLVVREI